MSTTAPGPVAAPAVLTGSPVVVVLGMMTKIPVAGVVWQVLHYLEGFRRLGYDVWYVEAHARTPSMFMERESDDGSAAAAAFLDRTLRRFGFGDRWAYHALHDDGAVHGCSEPELRALYGRAAMILNLHGGTQPTDELAATGRLVYLETDPVQLQVELHDGDPVTEAFLDAHVAFFTYGENWGRPGNRLPAAHRYPFRPTRQPVVVDWWATDAPAGHAFTSVANWRQRWREVRVDGEVFTWSKDLEFARIESLPARTGATFELALSGHDAEDLARLAAAGWLTREALPMSLDLDRYRSYLQRSRAEFTVAKDQNVRLRSGWCSDRSCTYLAAGRPVITQDTGLADVLPTGAGLHLWDALDDAVAAVEAVLADPAGESAAASAVATEFLAHDRVLGALLADVGLSPRPQRHRLDAADGPRPGPWPADLPLVPARRRPLVLDGDAETRVLAAPLPRPLPTVAPARPVASVVVPACDNLALTRLLVETVLADRRGRDLELVVVDNGSLDLTGPYLQQVARDARNLVVLSAGRNLGYAAAVNLGVAASRAPVVVLCNNDVVVTPGWVDGLLAHLGDGVGLVAPVTDGTPGPARVPRTWSTYGELLDAAARRAVDHAGASREVDRVTYCCVAIPRAAWEDVGPLDEGYGIGLFEDDDHVERLRAAGWRLLVADDVLVAHLGEATIGTLAPSGAHGELFRANRDRFEARWGRAWTPQVAPEDPGYTAMVGRLRALVADHVPTGAAVAVVSRGDPALVQLDGRPGLHVPAGDDGGWSGHHPADGPAAVAVVERAVSVGARYLLVPASSSWWLDSYAELRDHLAAGYRCVVDDGAGALYERSLP